MTDVPTLLDVVVVEDNPDNRMLFEVLFEDRYRLRQYDNGADALAGLAERRPDVVLLDISLPGMDGHEVLRRIRADAALATLPVVAVSAHAMTGDRERFLAGGFDDYVSKPIVDEDVLFAAIERHGKAGS